MHQGASTPGRNRTWCSGKGNRASHAGEPSSRPAPWPRSTLIPSTVQSKEKGPLLHSAGSVCLTYPRAQKCDAGRPVCNYCRLYGTSGDCVYEDTKRKPRKTSENVQRREILPLDTSPTAGIQSPPNDLSCVLPAHLSKLHPLVAAFRSQSGMPPNPFLNAVSNVSLDDLTLAL